MSVAIHAAHGKVGIVTLNRSDKLNAISVEFKKTFIERFSRGRLRPGHERGRS